MKSLLLAAFLLASGTASAVNFTCALGAKNRAASNAEGGFFIDSSGDHTILGGSLYINCKVSGKGDQTVGVSIGGIGPGLRYDKATAINIACPGLKKSKFLKAYESHERLKLYGLDVNASAGIGAKVGLFADEKARICLVTGVNLGLGASASISHLEFGELAGYQTQSQKQQKQKKN